MKVQESLVDLAESSFEVHASFDMKDHVGLAKKMCMGILSDIRLRKDWMWCLSTPSSPASSGYKMVVGMCTDEWKTLTRTSDGEDMTVSSTDPMELMLILGKLPYTHLFRMYIKVDNLLYCFPDEFFTSGNPAFQAIQDELIAKALELEKSFNQED